MADARLVVLLLVAWLAFATALGVSGAFIDIFEIPGVRVGVGLSVALLFSFLVCGCRGDAPVFTPYRRLIGVQAYRGQTIRSRD